LRNRCSKMPANVCIQGRNYIIPCKPQNILDTENKMAIMALMAFMSKMEQIMNKHMNVSIAEAKNRLSKIINEVVFAKKRVILNSHGRPKAAMISFDELKKFEEMEEAFSPSKNKRLTALNKAARLREKIYNRKKENVYDSSKDLYQIRKERGNEF
jgi:prevent-host-death family protein